MLELIIKNKIKHLIVEKKIKKSRLSLDLGYSKGFINTMLRGEKKFFNLEQIEKICNALDYPVWKLFKKEGGEELSSGMLILAESEAENIYSVDGPDLSEIRKKLNGLDRKSREHAMKLIDNMLDTF